MTGWRELVAMLGLKASEQERRAMSYLERRGQVFCVHFGIQNAIDKAREDWRQRRRPRAKEKSW